MTTPAPREPFRLSLRAQIAFKVFALAAVVQVTLSLVRTIYLDHSLRVTADTELFQHANRFVSGMPFDPATVTPRALIELGHSTAPFLSDFFLTVYSQSGEPLASTREPPVDLKEFEIDIAKLDSPTVLADPVPALELRGGDASRARTVVQKFTGRNGQPYILAASTDYVAGNWVVRELTWLLVVTTPIGLAAAAIVGWLIAGSAVAPLLRLGVLARELGPGSLNSSLDLGPAGRELKELQDQLNRALRRIDEGYERQSRFISNVSHELRTPIATLLTEAQTLRDFDRSPADVQRFVRSTQDEMRRLGRLIESFLTLSRVRDGKPKSMADRYPINDLVVESVASCRRMAEQYGVKLLPTLLEFDVGGSAEVVGDPELLCTMFDNVVRNAIRFSPRGETVRIAVRSEGRLVAVAIRDSGPGIPADLISLVFDRYSQAPAEHKSGNGMGLGLSIAQGIAELHGGKIHATNLESSGCQFVIRLPLAQVPGFVAD